MMEKTIVQTDPHKQDGQVKCPKCGSTDISTNFENGNLRCNFCHYEFEAEKVEGFVEDLDTLEGQVIGSGAQDIEEESDDLITLKCTSCGAEVVINTNESTQARCPWCRSTLSINHQIPNGAVPDVILPFKLTKEDAIKSMNNFVQAHQFYANPTFKAEYTPDNIMGIYFPYMLIDVKGHATFQGEGEHTVRRYTVKKDENHQETFYDADLYRVGRAFDIQVSGLSVQSNVERLNNRSSTQTNNIINAIMPFDTEHCVKFDSNYLSGFTSEKRDTNIKDLEPIIKEQIKDISRYSVNDTLGQYDRGVRWSHETLDLQGEQWKAAYLPVWLYSYYEKRDNGGILHYVAVNARTKETIGSIPLDTKKLLIVTLLIELVAFIIAFMMHDARFYLLLIIGLIYYLVISGSYRNSNARHTYESETKRTITNMEKRDVLIQRKERLRNSSMQGANNHALHGSTLSNSIKR